MLHADCLVDKPDFTYKLYAGTLLPLGFAALILLVEGVWTGCIKQGNVLRSNGFKWLLIILYFTLTTISTIVCQSFSSFILADNQQLLETHPTVIYFMTMLVGAGTYAYVVGGICGIFASEGWPSVKQSTIHGRSSPSSGTPLRAQHGRRFASSALKYSALSAASFGSTLRAFPSAL